MASNAALGSAVEVQTVAIDGGVLFRMSGRIDETLPIDFAAGAAGAVIFDLKGVEQISSFGVRNWISLLGNLSATYVGFINCRPSINIQFNSVARFGGGGELISLYVPYVCPQCQQLDEVLVDLRLRHAEIRGFNPPAHSCSGCASPSELDDVPEAFFFYAANAPPPNPPPVATRLIEGGGQRTGSVFRVSKSVHSSVTALWLHGALTRSTQLKRTLEGLEGDVVVIPHTLEVGDPGNLERLRPLLNLPGANVFLARIPMTLARDVIRIIGGFGTARVASVLLPGSCSRCMAVTTIECGPNEVRAAAVSAGCTKCGTRTPALLTDTDVRTLAAVPILQPPEAVARYLSTHPRPPSDEVTSSANARGDLLAGLNKYEIGARLGFGGMAEVFLARQRGVGGFEKQVVIKKILSHLSDDPYFVEMFLSEARLAARISHPNVVQTIDIGQQDGRYFIVLEFVDGLDLSRALRALEESAEQMPIEVALRIAVEICAALSAAHAVVGADGTPAPIIHRDVSPHNVLLSRNGFAKLSDFGIAKATGTRNDTPSQVVKGKLSYLAPEQVSGAADPSAQSDIFAAGLVLYYCLTLRQPFARDSEIATIAALLSGEFTDVSRLRRATPPGLDEIVRRALCSDLALRYATARQMQADLENVLHGLGSQASEGMMANWVRHVLELEARHRAAAKSRVDEGLSNAERTEPDRTVNIGGGRE